VDIADYCRNYRVGLLADDDDFVTALEQLLSDIDLQTEMGGQPAISPRESSPGPG